MSNSRVHRTGLGLLSALALLGLLLAVAGCRLKVPAEAPPPSAPTPEVMPPALRDDADLASLRQALAATLRYWQGQDAERELSACGKRFRVSDYVGALRRFAARLATTANGDGLALATAEDFTVCQPAAAPGGRDDLLVTGYYQPRFKARWRPEPPFVHPVYRLPPDLIEARVFSPAGESQTVGRLDHGRLSPYWTRAEIDNGRQLAGSELCFLADPVEVFVLQVQGSGLVEFEDGSTRQLLFAGTNGRPYRSIGRLLADEGRLPLADIDMPRIRRYLAEHLDDQQRILHYNERYVFFRLGEPACSGGPVGSMGAALTPGRSVAMDQDYFPLGGLYFLATERPVAAIDSPPTWQPMSRLVLHQDAGAAIKGPARLDFFWGSGDYPELAAGLMKQRGRLYQLIPKIPDNS